MTVRYQHCLIQKSLDAKNCKSENAPCLRQEQTQRSLTWNVNSFSLCTCCWTYWTFYLFLRCILLNLCNTFWVPWKYCQYSQLGMNFLIIAMNPKTTDAGYLKLKHKMLKTLSRSSCIYGERNTLTFRVENPLSEVRVLACMLTVSVPTGVDWNAAYFQHFVFFSNGKVFG